MLRDQIRAATPWLVTLTALLFFVLFPTLICAQLQQPNVMVNGSPVISQRPATRVGSEWFVPLAPVARALGATVALKTSMAGQGASLSPSRSIQVRRQDGTELIYEGSTGEIREKFVLAGLLNNPRQIALDVGIENILFPVSGIVALFGVNVHEDADRNALSIDTIMTDGKPQGPPSVPSWNLGAVNYAYGFTTNGVQYGQYATLKGDAIIGGHALFGDLMLNRVPSRNFLGFNHGTVRLQLDHTRTFFFGDQSSFKGLEAFANSVRGIGYQSQWRGFETYVFGGLAAGQTFASMAGGYARYDTTTGGFDLRRKVKGGLFSLNTNLFSSTSRKGGAVGAAYTASRFRNEFNIQALAGVFSGLSSRTVLVETTDKPGQQLLKTESDNTIIDLPGAVPAVDKTGNLIVLQPQQKQAQVDGAATGFSITDTFTPFKAFSATGQWQRYGKNFLVARDDSQFNANSNKVLSLSLRPSRYFSVTAGSSDRSYLLGNTGRQRSYTYGATGSLPVRFPVQVGFFRSIQLDALSPFGRFSLTQYSLNLPNIRRFSTFAFYSELRLGKDLVRGLNAGASLDHGRWGRFGVHDQLQMNRSHRAGLDWYRALGRGGAYLRFGVDRLDAGRDKPGLFPLAGIRIPLPHRHSFELTYVADRNSHLLQFELGGNLVHREMALSSSSVARVVIASPLTGKIYLDRNLNGRFDSSTDQPIHDVRVWLDDQRSMLSDAHGLFRFDQVAPGAHLLRAELNGVPAGLVFADPERRTIAVAPYQATAQDFRVIPTGQIQGKVLYLDYSQDSDHPVERAYPDARIIAGESLDTFSETNGNFLLGDMPPGTYRLTIDPQTIPKGYVPQPPAITLTVTPGATVRGVVFKLAIPPKPVIEKVAPPQGVPLGPGAAPTGGVKILPNTVRQ